jgi:hypothetical protein
VPGCRRLLVLSGSYVDTVRPIGAQGMSGSKALAVGSGEYVVAVDPGQAFR